MKSERARERESERGEKAGREREKETPLSVVLWTRYAVVCGPVRKRKRKKPHRQSFVAVDTV